MLQLLAWSRGSSYWQRRGRGDRWAAGISWHETSMPRDSSGRCAPVRGPSSAGGSFQPGVLWHEMSMPRDSPGRCAPVRGPPSRAGAPSSARSPGGPQSTRLGLAPASAGRGDCSHLHDVSPACPLRPHSRMNSLATPNREGVLSATGPLAPCEWLPLALVFNFKLDGADVLQVTRYVP